MITGIEKDKQRIVDIIVDSFDDNKSTNYIIKQDANRKQRLRRLVEYSVFQGEKFGKLFISDDKNGACIVLFPWSKKITLSSLLWDFRLVVTVIGLTRVKDILKREKLLKKNHPKTPFYHLWYIGVDSNHQNKGIGSKLLDEVLAYCEDKPVYLETSVVSNLDWYGKYGFEVIKTLDLVYTLYVLRKK